MCVLEILRSTFNFIFFFSRFFPSNFNHISMLVFFVVVCIGFRINYSIRPNHFKLSIKDRHGSMRMRSFVNLINSFIIFSTFCFFFLYYISFYFTFNKTNQSVIIIVIIMKMSFDCVQWSSQHVKTKLTIVVKWCEIWMI